MQTEAELLAGASPKAVTKAAVAPTPEPPKLTAKEVANLATNGGVAVAPTPVAVAALADVLPVPMENTPFLVEPRTMPDHVGVTADRLKAETPYNAAVAQWREDRKAMQSLRCVDDALAVSFDECRERRRQSHEAELLLAQRAVKLTREYAELQEARIPGVKAFAAKAAENLDAVTGDVAKRLNVAGVSVESQPAFRDNLPAAERTFLQTIRQTPDWQSANAAKREADEAVLATLQVVNGAKERAIEAQKSLIAKVAKLVA